MKQIIRFGAKAPSLPVRANAAGQPVPGNAAHLRQRAAKLAKAGDRAAAAKAWARYLDAPVEDSTLRAAGAAMAAGDHVSAEQRLRAHLATHPDDLQAHRLLGRVAIAVCRLPEAEAIVRALLAKVPGYLPLRADLATVLHLRGKGAEALVEIDALLARDPANRRYRGMKAGALDRTGDHAAAAAVLAELVREAPDDRALWMAYGQALRWLGRADEAAAALRRAVEIAPTYGPAWWSLASLRGGQLTAEDEPRLTAALAAPQATAEDRYHLQFALARLHEEAGAIEPALATYRAANAGRLAAIPAADRLSPGDRADRVRAWFTPALVAARAGSGDPAPDPIFILGMPRAGSTLLEQMLSCHPDIEATQELPDIPLLAQQIDRPTGAPAELYPEAIDTLTDSQLRELGETYLRRAAAKRREGRRLFIDKQPSNWVHAGFIHLILPNARIIDMRRDPLANCMAMFRQHFANGASYSFSFEGLAREYRRYVDLMAHYDAVMPGRIKRVTLEALIDDNEAVLRDLFAHLGLSFAPKSLRFHESTRAVYTPSAEQVRRPLNREGSALIERYRPHIADLAALLGDLAT